MASEFPETITIRHFSTKEVVLELVERFPLPKVKPIICFLPTPPPDDARLGDLEQPFATEKVNIKISPFQTLESDIKLTRNGPDEILRILFSCGDAKFRVGVSPASRGANASLVRLSGPEINYHALWHQSHSHLSLICCPPLNKWLASLSDMIPLSALSIPGTHNSTTCYRALPTVRCQAFSVSEQLENGIRFFDIRCNPNGKNFTLSHGNFPISLTGAKHFRDVLNETYAFLGRNPSETVLVSIKREGPGKLSDQDFSLVLQESFITQDPHRWYTSSLIPFLGQVRGKCVLLRRFYIHESLAHENDGRGFGIDAEHWEYNTPNCTTSSGNFIVQDFCEPAARQHIDHKIQYVRDHLARASQVKYSNTARDPAVKMPFYINFLSASNFWKLSCWPWKVAERLNPTVKRYLCTEHDISGNGGTGIVICDYAGKNGDWDLSRLVLGMNGLLQLRAMETKENGDKAEETEEAGKRNDHELREE